MEKIISELEPGLRDQLAKLADDIRTMETSLLTTKEGYLKVQGALELLDIIKKKDEEETHAALSDIGAD